MAVSLTCGSDGDLLGAGALALALGEPPTVAPLLLPHPALVLPLVLGPDRPQGQRVVLLCGLHRPELALSRPPFIARSDGQDPQRPQARQLLLALEPGHAEEELWKILRLQLAEHLHGLTFLEVGVCDLDVSSK